MKDHKFSTNQIHLEGHKKPFNSHSFPIFQTSTFYFDSPEHGAELFAGKGEGYIYTRLGNPTIDAVEKVVAGLEGGFGATATASGMSAVLASVFPFVKAGDHIIVSDTLYGASTTLLTEFAEKYGVESSVVKSTDLEEYKKNVKNNTKLIYIETPANPTLSITDIKGVSEIAKSADALLVVDNTFATPYLQRPFEFGADVIMHSATKYLNGHGDVIMGFSVGRTEAIHKQIRSFTKLTGGNANPFDSYLCLRGIKTLSLRMDKHNENAQKVAEYLQGHDKVLKVYYPGLSDFEGHELAEKQMDGFSSVIAFDLKGGFDAGKKLMKSIKMMTLAVSLGTVDTLIQHPASMTHSGVPKDERDKAGITDELTRISVGLEDVEDIISDLEQGLARL
ncbi:MAG: aminotransferase class I/II-fold pyridoxal phosphate-dependent enzyme [Acidobacteriota bacterium]